MKSILKKFTSIRRKLLSRSAELTTELAPKVKELNEIQQALAAAVGLPDPGAQPVHGIAVKCKRKPMSAAAKRKIAAAQRKRWAKFHAGKKSKA